MSVAIVSRSGYVVGDTYGEWFRVPRGTKISVWVGASGGVLMQLSRTQPPEPPLWEDPITIPASSRFARATSLGYVRFKNAAAGSAAVIDFTAE